MLTSTMLRTPSSSSTVASSDESSARTRFVITSTTLKRRGPAGSGGFGGRGVRAGAADGGVAPLPGRAGGFGARGLRSRTTIGLWPPFRARSSAFSSGRISAPVPFVSVSRTQTFPIGIKSRKERLRDLRQHLVHRLQEPVVLGARAVGDPEVAL